MADSDITSADYQNFINSKGAKPKCPLCGTSGWSLVNETNGRSYGLTTTSRVEPNAADLQATPILLLACRNCGFIAPILREKVVKGLEGADV